FHAEDGIRYRNVTGVQTCALPISAKPKCPNGSGEYLACCIERSNIVDTIASSGLPTTFFKIFCNILGLTSLLLPVTSIPKLLSASKNVVIFSGVGVS